MVFTAQRPDAERRLARGAPARSQSDILVGLPTRGTKLSDRCHVPLRRLRVARPSRRGHAILARCPARTRGAWRQGMHIIRRTGLILGGLLLLASSASAQTKPNFSGDWKMNAGKSNFGQMPAPATLTEKITHTEPSLKVQTAMTGDFEVNSDFSFTTDGKECQNAMGDLFKMTSTVKWDGDILMFDSKMDFQGTAMTGVDKWSLSPDGKTLTVQRHFNGPMGEGDAVMVLDKQ
jgi:hypothetical protein